MSDLPRWTLAELGARYHLEPRLNDMFVEGEFDKTLLIQVANKFGFERSIYAIDSVEIDGKCLDKWGLTSGNKQRVIALAQELVELSPHNCLLLVDKDFDHWRERQLTLPGLKYTIFTSLELHFLQPSIIDSIIDFSKAEVHARRLFFESLIEVLIELYAIRYTNEDLKLELEYLAPDKCIYVDQDRIRFDRTEYIKRYLNKNSKSQKFEFFTQRVGEMLTKFVGDYRQFIHGHDFIDVLCTALLANRALKSVACETVIRRSLILLLDKADDLEKNFV